MSLRLTNQLAPSESDLRGLRLNYALLIWMTWPCCISISFQFRFATRFLIFLGTVILLKKQINNITWEEVSVV